MSHTQSEVNKQKTITRKMIVPVPDWATWMAQDCFGVWYVFEFVPVVDMVEGWFAPDGKQEELYKGTQAMPWQRTLQRI